MSATETTSAGDWRIVRGVDTVTGGTLTNVRLQASRTANSRYASTPNALLQFACVKGQLVIHLQFAFQVGSKADSEISYRFDERPGHTIKGHILRGLKIVVIDDKREAVPFIDELQTANVLYVVISSLAKGRTSVEFRVTGASAAIEPARAKCH